MMSSLDMADVFLVLGRVFFVFRAPNELSRAMATEKQETMEKTRSRERKRPEKRKRDNKTRVEIYIERWKKRRHIRRKV